MLLYLLPHAVAYAVIAFALGFVLQTSVALTGDPSPRYGRALTTAWVAFALASFVSFAWYATLGGFLLLFVSKFLANGLALLFTVGTTALVFKSRLKVSALHAFIIAAVHMALTKGTTLAVLWLKGIILS